MFVLNISMKEFPMSSCPSLKRSILTLHLIIMVLVSIILLQSSEKMCTFNIFLRVYLSSIACYGTTSKNGTSVMPVFVKTVCLTNVN